MRSSSLVLRSLATIAALAFLTTSDFACGSDDSGVGFNGGGGTSTGGGGKITAAPANCGDLVACCLELGGEERSSCQTLAATFAGKGDDASCASALAGYQKTEACDGLPVAAGGSGDGGAGDGATSGKGGAPGKGGSPSKGGSPAQGGGPVEGGAAGEGGDAGAGSGPSGLTEAEACGQWAASFCERMNECGPGGLAQRYPTVAACLEGEAATVCPLVYFGASSWTPDGVAACAADFAALTCDDLARYALPTSCTPPPGKQKKGAACIAHSDCQSGNCSAIRIYYLFSDYAEEGKCIDPGAPGDKCPQEGCVSLRCDESKSLCRAFGESPASCQDRFDCAAGYQCVANKCLAPGITGSPCGQLPDRCSYALGLSCASGACATPEPAAPGAACKLNGSCIYGYYCHLTGIINGTCLAQTQEGEACSPTTGPGGIPENPCIYPTRCNAKTKTCALPSL